MSRNKIHSNQRVFERLVSWAKRSERQIEHINEARWITTNESERTWLVDLKLDEYRQFSRRVKTARFSFAGRNFFAAVGFGELIADNQVLVPVDANAGVITALID